MKDADTPAILLDDLVRAADDVPGVRRDDLSVGDRLLVATRNSIYSLTLRETGSFLVTGGVFERTGRGAVTLDVVGCSVGGHAVLTRCVAAPGLFLELGDGTRTTRIRQVRVVSSAHGGV
jgi:hypothetical protein